MSAIAGASPAGGDFAALKSRLKTTWMTGDYELFSRYMVKFADQVFGRLAIKPGIRLLDVGCGAGQFARLAARAGAQVTGCDISTNWLEKARQRAALEGVNVLFEEGDAEALPYEDASFDVVTSLIGAMFAPRPEAVAAELTRVCRPGGTIVMANWTPGGFVGQMFKAIAKHIAPSGMPSPALWGDHGTVCDRFHGKVSAISCTARMFTFEYPFGPADVVEFFRVNYGPMTRAFASLDPGGQEQLRGELNALWSSNNKAGRKSTAVDAEYLEVVAIRAN